jgi:hypothetical protein
MTARYPLVLNGAAIQELQTGDTITGLAASGANSDITSLSGLTTALTVAQGGTGATTLTGLLKGNGTSAFTAATAGTDYVAIGGALGTPSSGTLTNCTFPTLNQNTTGTAANLSGAPTLPSGITLSASTLGGNLTGGDYSLTRTMYKDTGWVYYNSNTTAALDFTNGSQQRWAPTASSSPTLSITNWPPSGNLGELLIEGVNLGAAGTITWPTINWITSTGATTTTFSANGVTLQTSGTDWCLLWTRDAGTTIYGKFVR